MEYAFAVAGLLALGYCIVVYVGARLYQAREARTFERQLLPKPPAAAVPVPAKPLPAPRDGALVGRLEIPRLNVSVMVIQGVDNGDLKRAAGHIPGTALPGEAGNVGIAAHRDTFFRPLRNVRPDDSITLQTAHGTYRYRVTFTKVVPPEDVQVLYPTGHDSLTLVTCYPFYYVGAAPDRFIVRADRIVGG